VVSLKRSINTLKGAEVLFTPTAIDGIQEKRQYGVNQYGADECTAIRPNILCCQASKIP
jgi:hypothetical protein